MVTCNMLIIYKTVDTSIISTIEILLIQIKTIMAACKCFNSSNCKTV